jgi:hypothetical protein
LIILSRRGFKTESDQTLPVAPKICAVHGFAFARLCA